MTDKTLDELYIVQNSSNSSTFSYKTASRHWFLGFFPNYLLQDTCCPVQPVLCRYFKIFFLNLLMLSLFFNGPLSQGSRNPGAAVHYQATACLKPACEQARAHKAPLVRVENACACTKLHLHEWCPPLVWGHANALPSCDLSFAHKHKRPLLKCPPLVQVELHA